MKLRKISFTVSHTVNIDDYESIKPEITMEYEFDDGEIKSLTDEQYQERIVECIQDTRDLWTTNYLQHLRFAHDFKKAKGKPTGKILQLFELAKKPDTNVAGTPTTKKLF